MPVNNIVDECLNAEEGIILGSLDIQNAFDVTCWPNILKRLQDCACTKYLFYLVKIYLHQRSAVFSTNSIKKEWIITLKGRAAARCYGIFNTHSLLKLILAKQTKAITFAVDLIFDRIKTVVDAENFSNTELSKITTWAKNYKIELMKINQQPC